MPIDSFGSFLKTLRKKRGYTQLELSKILCLSREAYSNYELNRCQPSPHIIAKISSILNFNFFLFFINFSDLDIINLNYIDEMSLNSMEIYQLFDLYSKLHPTDRKQILRYLNIKNNLFIP